MSEKFFDLEIITPFEIIYQEKVRHIKLPGSDGYFGILANHAPLVTNLRVGEIKVGIQSDEKYFATRGGIVEVLQKKTTVLVETAEEATTIDVERAIYAKERAQRRLTEKVPGTDIERAKDAWYKAINRLKVSAKIARE